MRRDERHYYGYPSQGGWTTLIQFVTKEVERTGNRHIELLNLCTLAQGVYHKTKAYVAEREADRDS